MKTYKQHEACIRVRRALWSAVIFLALIGSAVAVRRMVHLVPIAVRGYHPPAVTSNPAAAQFASLVWFICALSVSNSCSYCAWFALHGPGSVAVQFNDSRPPSPVAPLEWSRFRRLPVL